MSWDWKKRLQTEDSSPEELALETPQAEESAQQGEHSQTDDTTQAKTSAGMPGGAE